MPSSETSDAVVSFCGEDHIVSPHERLTIGREGDIAVDDNRFLHRMFLVIEQRDGYWFIHNVGSQLGATITDASGTMEAFLAPGSSIPLVFGSTSVVFTAGPTTYEVLVSTSQRAYSSPAIPLEVGDGTTVGGVSMTTDQLLLVLALAESRLRRNGSGSAMLLPSSQEAADRLGWKTTKFSRKLDNVCDKLAKLGVRGLRGDVSSYASNRRARLVEYAVATRLVTVDDLEVLDRHIASVGVA